MNEEHQIVAPMAPLVWEGDKGAFAKAFITAQKSMESIKKASSNPAFKSKYADLAEVVEAVVPALNEAGIGVLQFPSFNGDMVSVTTILLHESGASVTGVLDLRPSKTDPQGVGSATTYGRRYSLQAMTGTAPEDDDGNAASGPRQEQQRRDPPRREEHHRPAALVAAEAAILLCDTVEACDEWSAKNKAMLDGIDDDNIYQAILRCWKNRRAALAPPKIENRAKASDFNPAELEGVMA